MIGRLGQVIRWGFYGLFGALFLFAGGTQLLDVFLEDRGYPGLAGTLYLYSGLTRLIDAPNGGAIIMTALVIIAIAITGLIVRACFYVFAGR